MVSRSVSTSKMAGNSNMVFWFYNVYMVRVGCRSVGQFPENSLTWCRSSTRRMKLSVQVFTWFGSDVDRLANFQKIA